MRLTFINKLEEAMGKDLSIFVLTADLGFNVFENIKTKYPDRFINAGVAEANMVSVAAGLASEGFNVFIYSMSTFITLRVYEQIRNDLCYDDFGVKIISVGGGFNYAAQGISHHTLEDMAIMRSLPNMTVINPGCREEASALAEVIINYKHPLYLRLGRHYDLNEYPVIDNLSFDQPILVKPEGDYLMLVNGNMLNVALEVWKKMTDLNYHLKIVSVPVVKPLNNQKILNLIKSAKIVFTLEEHGLTGGFGSAVSELAVDHQIEFKLKRFGLPDEFIKGVGSQDYLRKLAGLSTDKIIEEIFKLINL